MLSPETLGLVAQEPLGAAPVGRHAPLFTLRGHSAAVQCVALHRSRDLALSGDAEGSLRLWQLRQRRELACLVAHGGEALLQARFLRAPDGAEGVLSQGRDGKVKIWLLETLLDGAAAAAAAPLRELDTGAQHFCKALCADWQEDTIEREADGNDCHPGRNPFLVVTPSFELSTALLWDLRAPRPVQRYVPPVTGGATVDLQDFSSGTAGREALDGEVGEKSPAEVSVDSNKTGGMLMAMAFANHRFDGDAMLLTGHEDGILRWFDMRTARCCMAVTTAEKQPRGNASAGSMARAEAHTDEAVDELPMGKQPILAVAADERGGQCAVGTAGADVLIMRTDLKKFRAKERRRIRMGKAGCGCAVLCDDRVLALGGWDARVRLFRWQDVSEICVLDGHSDSIYGASVRCQYRLRPSFTADEEHSVLPSDFICASASKDGRIVIWDASLGRVP
eukprot:scaffold903_cov262-Pinguiococcus_pyrenoidosus.AAC.28